MSLVLLGERGRKSGAGAVKEWVKAPIVVVVLIFSTASGALVVGGVRDTYIYPIHPSIHPEIALSVQWSRTNQSVAVCGRVAKRQTRVTAMQIIIYIYIYP